MTLIRTHDGLIGLTIQGQVIWCDDIGHAVRMAFTHVNRDMDIMSMKDIQREFDYALEVLDKNHHSLAEFGHLGGFMFTLAEEEENEF